MNKEYIEYHSLLSALIEAEHPWTDFDDAYEIVRNAPKADVVEVVRCKDCKHQEQCCEFIMISGRDKNIDFCSYGERENEGK